jgi:hypothetical protein
MSYVAAVLVLVLSLSRSLDALAADATAAPAPAAQGAPKAAAAGQGGGQAQFVTFRNDRLSLYVERAPVRDLMNEIARQTGAEVSGEMPEGALVSARFDDVPLRDAFERLYGRKNFTLNYDNEGRLRRITLLGAPLPPAAGGHAERAWPFDDHVKRSADLAWAFMSADTRYPVRGRLAAAIGADSATFRDLAIAAARNEDPRVRALGLKRALEAVRSNRQVREAIMVALRDLPDDAIARLARQFAQENAEEFVRRIARGGGEEELRTRVTPIVAQLDGIGPEK